MNKTKTSEYEEEDAYSLSDGEYIYEVLRKYSYRIGKYLILFSELEEDINSSLLSCINGQSNQLGSVVIKKLGFEAKTDLFRAFHLQFIGIMFKDSEKEENRTRFDKLYGKIKRFQRFRNIVAHANWMTLTKHGYVRTSFGNTNEGIITFTMTKILPSDIDVEIKEIEKFSDELFSFHEDINFCS